MRKRRSIVLSTAFALGFALLTLALSMLVLTLSPAGSKSLKAFDPRPDFLDRPHRHRAAPAGSAQR